MFFHVFVSGLPYQLPSLRRQGWRKGYRCDTWLDEDSIGLIRKYEVDCLGVWIYDIPLPHRGRRWIFATL